MVDSSQAPLYIPLNCSSSQFRLLHLQPRQPRTITRRQRRGLSRQRRPRRKFRFNPAIDNAITCSLHLANLDDEESRYEALSYEWGDPGKAPLSVLIANEKVEVRENLWWALWHMRDEHKVKILWVDALCINQEDNQERTHQVKQMGRIYARADMVIAWIGLGTEHLPHMEVAFNVVNRVEDYQYEQDISPSTWNESVSIFLSRPYWNRLWILQELILAKDITIQCGKLRLLWKLLVCFFTRFVSVSSVSTWHMATLVPATICKQRHDLGVISTPSLLQLCYTYRESMCSDSRDKFYGLLSLSQKCCQACVIADYRKPTLTVTEVVLRHTISSHTNHSDDSIPWYDLIPEFSEILKKIEIRYHAPNSGLRLEQIFPAIHKTRHNFDVLSINSTFHGKVRLLDHPCYNVSGSAVRNGDLIYSLTPMEFIFGREHQGCLLLVGVASGKKSFTEAYPERFNPIRSQAVLLYVSYRALQWICLTFRPKRRSFSWYIEGCSVNDLSPASSGLITKFGL